MGLSRRSTVEFQGISSSSSSEQLSETGGKSDSAGFLEAQDNNAEVHWKAKELSSASGFLSARQKSRSSSLLQDKLRSSELFDTRVNKSFHKGNKPLVKLN